MKDQWDCVLNDLEELGGEEFLVLTGQYNIEIFLVASASCHLALPYIIRPMLRLCKNRSEDNLSFSRIQSLHHLLEVDYHDEEECSVVSTLDNRLENNLLTQYQSTFFQEKGTVLVDELAECVFKVSL